MRFRLFGLVSLMAISISISAPVNADLFKDLKKALEDVESQLAPGLSQGSNSQSSNSSVGGTTATSSQQGNSASTGSQSTGSEKARVSIERLCKPVTSASVYNKLGKPDFATIEKDFGKNKGDIEFALKKFSPRAHPYLVSFEIYKTGFETDEVAELFANFARRPTTEDLAVIASTANFKGFDAKKKRRAADARFAYGLVHSFFPDAGGNSALGEQLIKEAAKSNQFAARYIEGLRWYKGYGRQVNLTNAVTWMRPGYEVAQYQDGDLSQIIEDTFMRLVVEPAYEGRGLYVDMIAEAERQRAALEQSIDQNAGTSSIGYVLAPKVMELTRTRGELLIDLATIGKVGSEVERYKADYNMLANQSNPTVPTVTELVVKTEEFEAFLQQQQNSFVALEQEGQQRLQGLYQRAEQYVADSRQVTLSLTVSLMFGGGGFAEALDPDVMYLWAQADKARPVACEIHRTILAYGQRTNAQLQPKEVTFSENVFPAKKKKKKKR